MSTLAPVNCRAQIDPACYHGQPQDPEVPMSADGTYDGVTIVCDACYVALMPLTPSGHALLEEIPDAIAAYRQRAGVTEP